VPQHVVFGGAEMAKLFDIVPVVVTSVLCDDNFLRDLHAGRHGSSIKRDGNILLEDLGRLDSFVISKPLPKCTG
jgi:hypothetical protein